MSAVDVVEDDGLENIDLKENSTAPLTVEVVVENEICDNILSNVGELVPIDDEAEAVEAAPQRIPAWKTAMARVRQRASKIPLPTVRVKLPALGGACFGRRSSTVQVA